MKIISVDEEYKRNKELKKKDVESILEWAKKQPHLPKLNELDVIHHLHGCYYSLELTKTKLDLTFTCMTRFNDIFNYEINKDFLKQMELVTFCPLEGTTPEGNRVLYCTLHKCSPSEIDVAIHFKILAWMIRMWPLRDGTSAGNIILLNLEHMTLTHLARANLLLLKKLLFCFQEMPLIRITGIHFINAPSVANKILSIAKMFGIKDLLKLYVSHESIDDVQKCIPKEMLPIFMNGEGPTLEKLHDTMKNQILDSAEYMQTYCTKTVDESKRQQKCKIMDNTFGLEGSFRTIEID